MYGLEMGKSDLAEEEPRSKAYHLLQPFLELAEGLKGLLRK
jgi:hypothetical protein